MTKSETKEKGVNEGKPWLADHYEQLYSLIEQGYKISHIAAELYRSYGGVYSRLKLKAGEDIVDGGKSFEYVQKKTGLTKCAIDSAITTYKIEKEVETYKKSLYEKNKLLKENFEKEKRE